MERLLGLKSNFVSVVTERGVSFLELSALRTLLFELWPTQGQITSKGSSVGGLALSSEEL